MSWKPQSVLWAIGLNLLMAGWAWALPLTEYNKLRDVVVEGTPKGLHIQIQFREPPINYTAPEFFQKSVQIDLPFAYLTPAKQYFPTGDDEIRQVYVSQYNKELLRIRFILGDKRANLAGRFQLKRIGNTLDILVRPAGAAENPDHPVPDSKAPIEDPLNAYLASSGPAFQAETTHQSKPESKLESKQTGSSSVHAEHQADPFLGLLKEVDKTPESPDAQQIDKKESLSDVVGSAFRKEEKPETQTSMANGFGRHADLLEEENRDGGPDLLSASFKMFYTLALVLGILFLVFHLFKKYVWKNGVFGSESKPIKVLSTGFLGPKKSIALVEVAGEILVLGIANDNISLLANVEDPEQIDLIKGRGSAKSKDNRHAPAQRATRNSKVQSAAASGTETGDEVITGTLEPPPVEKPRPKVDAYESVLRKNKTTNPFPEFVKKFAEESGDESRALDGFEDRLRKTLGRNPEA